ncbi:MAG: hypothetical protein M5U08_03760 [Burkholderiales bacterium]|nr:hypothetical protein [Burkholderiales bacterium]
MSLLLEALKKAEQAKQGGGAPDPESTLHGGEGLSLAPTGTPAPTAPATPAGERTPVTRDRLPDIDHSTLEILSDDLPSATTTREPAATGAPATEQPAAASRRPGARAAAARAPAEAGEDLDREQAGREAARRLFEAKPADYDPRRPFKITLVTLGVAAIAIIVYFWWQTQPRSLQVAQPPAPPTQIAAAPAPANAAPRRHRRPRRRRRRIQARRPRPRRHRPPPRRPADRHRVRRPRRRSRWRRGLRRARARPRSGTAPPRRGASGPRRPRPYAPHLARTYR